INSVFSANSTQPIYGGQMGYTKSVGPSIVNQLLLSASYVSLFFSPPDYAAAIKTFPGTWLFSEGAPFEGLGGSASYPIYNYPQGRKMRQWQLVDDFSKIWSRHTFKAGANVRLNRASDYATQINQFGFVTFSSMTDFFQGSLTKGSTFTQNFPQLGAVNLSQYSAGFYGQDEWKLRPNLTLTLALRLDRNSNIQCAGNCFTEFGAPFAAVPHSVSIPYNQVIQTGLSHAFPASEAVVPEPRIGVAYGVTKSTILRGGFGIFSDLNQAVVADRFILNSPNVPSFSTHAGLIALNDPNSIYASVANSNAAFERGFAGGATLAQLQAAVPLGFNPPNFNTVSANMRTPKYYEWNFEIQRQIGARYMFSVNYVGNHGYDEISQNVFQNAFSPNNFAGLPAAQPDPRFNEIRELNNSGWSNYEGLVTSFRWRMTNDFIGSFSYTWSHALDTCSNACLERFNTQSAPSLQLQVSPFGQDALNYSNADYDARHSLNANYVYTVSPAHFQNSLMKHALGNWMVAGTFLFHSGYPFSAINTAVRGAQGIGGASGLTTQTFLADYLGVGYPSCSGPNAPCVTASQFATAANQHDFGNIPRNSFRGPGYFDTDMNLSRIIAVKERYRLQIGAYFFNILNHPNFDNPGNDVNRSTFGQITRTVSPPSSPYGAFQGSSVSGRVIESQVRFTF
ncbi:MAG: TonB-dependent receptor, partial [Bryobacterales bacterium]|nr:TonB-dependent receptor [Bryobacterales bacterium]